MRFEEMTIAELKVYLDGKEKLSPEEEAKLKADQRRGAAALLRNFSRKKEINRREEVRLKKMLSEEDYLRNQGYEAIAGVDEAGRGPLAGPVVAAAVILDPAIMIRNLNDSKQLSSAAREKIFDQIVFNALSYGIGSASREEIDQVNIHAASMMAMNRALEKLVIKPDYVLVDGFFIRDCPYQQKAIKSGDTLSMSIAAASVLAKVSRDKIMLDLHRKYPQYGFDRNMGYGTAEHRQAISSYGPCPMHRRSFRLDYS